MGSKEKLINKIDDNNETKIPEKMSYFEFTELLCNIKTNKTGTPKKTSFKQFTDKLCNRLKYEIDLLRKYNENNYNKFIYFLSILYEMSNGDYYDLKIINHILEKIKDMEIQNKISESLNEKYKLGRLPGESDSEIIKYILPKIKAMKIHNIISELRDQMHKWHDIDLPCENDLSQLNLLLTKIISPLRDYIIK